MEANFKVPTPIQRQAVPILCGGDELLAIAPTGSGKTLAFLLPIIMKLKRHEEGGRARAPLGAHQGARGTIRAHFAHFI